MNQDQLIRFLMDNIDVEALVNARNNGSMIMYFANVAGRLQGGNITQTQPQRNARPTGRTTQTASVQNVPVQDLNEEADDRPPRYTPTTAQTQPANPTVTRNNRNQNAQPNQNTDRVRVSRL